MVLLNVSNDFYSEIQKRVVEKASQKNLKLVVFAQDDLAEQKIFDYIYQYGIPKSINDGYYSLFYLSQIISELIYKVRVIQKNRKFDIFFVKRYHELTIFIVFSNVFITTPVVTEMMINNPATARFKSSPVLGAVVVFVDEASVSGLITGVSLGVSILTSLVHK